MFKIAPHQAGLYYARGAQVLCPLNASIKKYQAVQTESGHVLIPDWHDGGPSITDLLEWYGGKIVEVEALIEPPYNGSYITEENFPKVKNHAAMKKWRENHST